MLRLCDEKKMDKKSRSHVYIEMFHVTVSITFSCEFCKSFYSNYERSSATLPGCKCIESKFVVTSNVFGPIDIRYVHIHNHTVHNVRMQQHLRLPWLPLCIVKIVKINMHELLNWMNAPSQHHSAHIVSTYLVCASLTIHEHNKQYFPVQAASLLLSIVAQRRSHFCRHRHFFFYGLFGCNIFARIKSDKFYVIQWKQHRTSSLHKA